MIKYRQTIAHFSQKKRYTCGPAALRCIFDATEEEMAKWVKCSSKGTHHYDILSIMRENNIECDYIHFSQTDHQNHIWWLKSCSYRWPVLIACDFISQGKRGRPSSRYHYVLLANGMSYDPSNDRESPIDTMNSEFNKKFLITHAIIFNRELPNWKRNLISSL